jgi:hypothetical protein
LPVEVRPVTVILQERLYPQPNIKKRTNQENDGPYRESWPGPVEYLRPEFPVDWLLPHLSPL